ncbi:protein regulator of cytokinesis 1-like isoform X2 [Hyla sarda]|uniref:protein regulator of cytokinesis 1-like isoform X2 n=1 Tax=Hyla sarda TaxID=327740 RepID=UPI0024C3E807|nr:protein regulator of cytokinesis 1-like isoform X2 [Hyla sarda]
MLFAVHFEVKTKTRFRLRNLQPESLEGFHKSPPQSLFLPLSLSSVGIITSEMLASSVISSTNQALASLMDIWDGLGIKEDMRLRRIEEVKKHIEELFNRMIHEEREMKDRIEKSILFCRKELKSLCHDLSVEEYKIDESMTMLQIERDLRLRLELLTKQKNERMEELRMLQEKDQELCSDLCVTPYYIPSGCIPSLAQIKELKEHITVQTEEKRKRLQVFSTLRAEIRQCLDEIGRQPENSLEQDAVCEDEEAFFLTPENIKALSVLKAQLEIKREDLLSILNTVKEKVNSLWDLLKVAQEERTACQKVSGSSISEELRMLESELARLDELKMANLKQVILNIRQELNSYWDKCFYTLEQRKQFTAFYSDDFTEDLLSQHDEEVVKMKMLYDKCQIILDAVAKWETSWTQFVILEKKAMDPNRFSNRGGTLLKEEKERAKLQKLLSKLEEDLKSRIDLWEAEQGCPFLIKGNKFMDYVASQWDMLKQQKEREKQDRTQKKEETTPFKTPIKRPAGLCSQGTPSSKNRKLNGTTNSTMSRTNITHSSGSQTGKVPLATIKEEISKKSSKEAIFNSTINENL